MKKTHGYAHRGLKDLTYKSWSHMKYRCDNPAFKQYRDYGGRGIIYDPSWSKFENFLKDMGERPPNTTLERIDVNGNYEPSNCKWATTKEQCNNKRNKLLITFKGFTFRPDRWAEILQINLGCFYSRWYKHLSNPTKYPLVNVFRSHKRHRHGGISKDVHGKHVVNIDQERARYSDLA